MGVIVLGDPDRLVQGLAKKGQGDGGFAFDVAASDGGKDAGEGGGGIRGG
jgi:hypothetical protein